MISLRFTISNTFYSTHGTFIYYIYSFLVVKFVNVFGTTKTGMLCTQIHGWKEMYVAEISEIWQLNKIILLDYWKTRSKYDSMILNS